LSPKELHILRCRYGLAGEDEKTLNQLALEYGVSRESIRQLEVKALGKLREAALREGFNVN
jgi:DNA-directed RNA polymerase sigma subunit (sigma70/sigma32)